jgi:hypothetical protein
MGPKRREKREKPKVSAEQTIKFCLIPSENLHFILYWFDVYLVSLWQKLHYFFQEWRKVLGLVS